jgi:hypothetical protein
MGSYPTVVDWNNDGKHDLLVGDSYGYVNLYMNTNNNTNSVLDYGTLVQAGGVDLLLDERATPDVTDWNEDGKKDLLVGDLDGKIYIYINTGTDNAPVFESAETLMVGGSVFDADFGTGVGGRAAPRIYDWDGDLKKDLLVGAVDGYVYYLRNEGTNSEPVFNSSQKLLLEDGSALRYISTSSASAPRSRLDIADWNNDGLADMVIGGADGRIMLFLACLEPVMISDMSPLYYHTLQEAYNSSMDGDTILSQDAIFEETLYIDQNKTVIFENGYDCAYTSVIGETTINGTLSITNGKLTINSGKLIIGSSA